MVFEESTVIRRIGALFLRCQRVLVAQRSRPVPGGLPEHARLVPLQLRRHARHPISIGRALVRRYRQVPREQRRSLALVPQHPRIRVLRLPRGLPARRRLEDLQRSLFSLFLYNHSIAGIYPGLITHSAVLCERLADLSLGFYSLIK